MFIDGIDIAARRDLSGFALDVDRKIPLSGCTAIFGPSGAGKSTLLRLIAGFDRPDAGRIAFGDALWCDMSASVFTPAHQRPVGYMFQDGRLFPHLSVEKNLLYADRRSNAGDAPYTVSDIVEAFDLKPLLDRRPDTLSGGERQRAALARTMLTRPKLLLLDEPLSALDRGRKAEIMPYLDNLAGRFGVPALYVSHNVDEIVRLADETVILKAGRVEAVGATAAVLNAYGVDASTEAFDMGAVVTGVVADHDEAYHLTRVALGDGVISLPINKQKSVGEAVNIRIDARNVAIAASAPQDISIRNVLPAVITTMKRRPDSPFVDIVLRAGDATLQAQVTKAASDDLSLAPGGSVYALVKTASFEI